MRVLLFRRVYKPQDIYKQSCKNKRLLNFITPPKRDVQVLGGKLRYRLCVGLSSIAQSLDSIALSLSRGDRRIALMFSYRRHASSGRRVPQHETIKSSCNDSHKGVDATSHRQRSPFIALGMRELHILGLMKIIPDDRQLFFCAVTQFPGRSGPLVLYPKFYFVPPG